MSKIWTGKSFYDDIKSTEITFTDNLGNVSDIGGDITWPTYKNVSQYLKFMYNDLAVFSLANENKCLTYTPGAFSGTMTMRSILDLCNIIGGTSSVPYRTDNFNIYAYESDSSKAIKRSGMDAPSEFFKLTRVNMSSEIGGVNNGSNAPYEGHLTIYATVSVPNGTGSPNKMPIATIPIDDSEYLSLSYNPIIVLPADFNEDSTLRVELEYCLRGRASNISAFGRGSTITIKNCFDAENEFVFLDAYVDDVDLFVTFGGSRNIKLKDIIYIYDIIFDIKKDLTGSYTVNLGGWEKTTAVPNPDSTLYDGVYRSSSNYNVSSGVATMTITLTNLSSFTMYIRSYAESSYDYVMVSQLDQTIDNNTSYSNSTLIKAHTRGNQKSGTSISNYTKVSFTGIDKGQHRITIVYRKDISGNSNDDRGYVLIPKNQ
jgi:hypothetical protein